VTPRRLRHRAGLALPAALFSLAVILLFVAGSAFSATQEARASAGSLAERLALEAAEYGTAAVLRDWDPSWNVATPVGQMLGPFLHALSGGAAATVRLTRTGMTTWWAVSEGTVGAARSRHSARRTINAAFRLDLPPEPIDAALGVADSAQVTGSGLVVGVDSLEVVPACVAAVSGGAGVAAADTMRVCDGVCGIAGSGIVGTPPLSPDSTISSRIATLDSGLVVDLVLPAGAIVTPLPVSNAGACDTSVVTNWGDPLGGACAAHLPVIRALGDVTVRAGRGQGILVAGGDVTFENGAFFAGLVVAHDDFVTGSGGGVVLGAVLARDARRGSGDHSWIAGGGLVRRSSCRVQLARLGAAPPIRLRERWWVEFD
jgi:hypothetical protein